MERKSFVFYKSFYEAMKDVDTETQLVLFDAICRKGLYDEKVNLSGTAKTLFTLIEPQLSANTKKFLNGQKGGRPNK